MRESYDVIVVGAGASGCALAARLAEDPARKVLLVDAGPHFAREADYPPELRYGALFGASAPGQRTTSAASRCAKPQATAGGRPASRAAR